jgi:glycosyltransferase involved in cell wall biosynthesis
VRIAHISTSDCRGGAAKAAYRLHQGLVSIGVDSHFIVQEKATDDARVHRPSNLYGKVIAKLSAKLEEFDAKKVKGTQWFSFARGWDQLNAQLARLQPDVINFHWINKGFVRLETLQRLAYPIVWTLHDMWPFTGGCHYTGDCSRYLDSCGKCPQLASQNEQDASRRIFSRKQAAWEKVPIQVITPSLWMANCARASAIFRAKTIKTIPYGLATDVYKPLDQAFARYALGLPADKLIILFGADAGTADPRKGFDLLLKALDFIKADQALSSKILLAVFGGNPSNSEKVHGFETRYLGKLFDDASLALLYSAADVFVAPSREDNLPNTILEAMACGTPCAAFRIGGMPDMIVPDQTGYLATPFDASDLAKGIKQLLNAPDKMALRLRNRTHVTEQFGLQRQAERYLELYQTLPGNPHA